MAAALGWTSSAYHFYESTRGYKGQYLPMDLAHRIAGILAERGINPDEVLELAGVGAEKTPAPTLSAGQERLLEIFSELDGHQREMLLELGELMRRAATAPVPDRPTVHAPGAAGYHGKEARR